MAYRECGQGRAALAGGIGTDGYNPGWLEWMGRRVVNVMVAVTAIMVAVIVSVMVVAIEVFDWLSHRLRPDAHCCRPSSSSSSWSLLAGFDSGSVVAVAVVVIVVGCFRQPDASLPPWHLEYYWLGCRAPERAPLT